MSKVKLSDNNIKEIIKRIKSGESIRSVSRVFNCSQTLIQNTLDNEGFSNKGLKISKKRFSDDKDYIAVCNKTEKEFKDYLNISGALTIHVKEIYPDFILESKYKRKKIEIETGKFWYEPFFNIVEYNKEKKDVIKCAACEWTSYDTENTSGSLTKHIKEVHGLSVIEYQDKFNERHLFKSFNEAESYKQDILSNPDKQVKCGICGEIMKTITNSHLKKHGFSVKEYKIQFGEEINSKSTIDKLTKNCGKISNFKFKETKIEKLIFSKLEELGIKFDAQKKSDGYYYDFYLHERDIFIETDGIFWHGHDRDENWNYSTLNNVINDYRKSTVKPDGKVFRLIEDISINEEILDKIKTKEDFYNYLNKENFNIKNHKIFNLKENDILFTKSKCLKSNQSLKPKFKNKLIDNLLFLWTNFYNPELSDNFVDIDKRKREFKLKGIFFKEFYEAKKIGNKNMNDFFLGGDSENDMLKKVIEYRLGLNKAAEFFSFNIKNLYRGIEVRTMFNVGIFPIKQAKEIFEEFVRNDNSVVYDPFTGWASRLMSMENLIKNKNCRYIGNDLNSNLSKGYNRIISDNFKGSEKKIDISFTSSTDERTELIGTVDYIFTSPPFYNDEIYFDDYELYKNIREWEEELLIPVFKNCFKYLKSGKYISIDIKELYKDSIINCLEYCGFKVSHKDYYKVTKSHYNKNKGKNQLIIHARKP